mmetsp:Transcript_15069/g.38566  ORF Transcript_15069/g.38566 Transcript_15069/m.38566 type:complete len:218 (-) Transcript_15069:471-1124(-)
MFPVLLRSASNAAIPHDNRHQVPRPPQTFTTLRPPSTHLSPAPTLLLLRLVHGPRAGAADGGVLVVALREEPHGGGHDLLDDGLLALDVGLRKLEDKVADVALLPVESRAARLETSEDVLDVVDFAPVLEALLRGGEVVVGGGARRDGGGGAAGGNGERAARGGERGARKEGGGGGDGGDEGAHFGGGNGRVRDVAVRGGALGMDGNRRGREGLSGR